MVDSKIQEGPWLNGPEKFVQKDSTNWQREKCSLLGPGSCVHTFLTKGYSITNKEQGIILQNSASIYRMNLSRNVRFFIDDVPFMGYYDKKLPDATTSHHLSVYSSAALNLLNVGYDCSSRVLLLAALKSPSKQIDFH